MYKERLKQYENRWLSNYTCRRSRKLSVFWVSDCSRFLIMKHGGHSDYCDRMVGTGYCGTYYDLYDLKEEFEASMFKNGNSLLKKWDGRWLKTYWKEVEDITKEVSESK